MSFFTEVAVRRLATASRTAARPTLTSTLPRAAFSSTARQEKTATETVKDGLKAVDRAVSDKLVDGIDVAAAVGTKAKEVGNEITGKAQEYSGEAAGKAQEYRGEAAGKTSELAGKAKGSASNLAGQASGKTSEMAGKAKGKAEEIKGKM